MRVQLAVEGDVPQFSELAREVEPLFGPMLDDPAFHRAVAKNVARRSAVCVRVEDAQPGAPLLGALLFSPDDHGAEIGWLVVAERARRRGIGRLLVEDVSNRFAAAAELRVVTFGTQESGLPARAFFTDLGFDAAESAPPGPEGGQRQVFRRVRRT